MTLGQRVSEVINDGPINGLCSYTYLGVYMDNSFGWKARVQTVCYHLEQTHSESERLLYKAALQSKFICQKTCRYLKTSHLKLACQVTVMKAVERNRNQSLQASTENKV